MRVCRVGKELPEGGWVDNDGSTSNNSNGRIVVGENGKVQDVLCPVALNHGREGEG